MQRPAHLLLSVLLIALLSTPARAAETSADDGKKPATYSGHGADSVTSEMLEQFAPPPVDPELERRIEMMMDVRSPGMGMVTPDGKRMFFSWTITGTRQVWRLDGPGTFPIQMTGGSDHSFVEDITKDGRFLVIKRDKKGEEYPGLYLQPVDGGELELIRRAPKVRVGYEGLSLDGRSLYFSANDVKPDAIALYKYEIESGETSRIFNQEGLWTIVGNWKDERLLLWKGLGSHRSAFYELELKSGKLTPRLGADEFEDYIATYAADGENLLVLTPKFGEFKRLYLYKDGEFTPITEDVPHDISYFWTDDGHRRIFAQVNEGGYVRALVIDAATYKTLPLPEFPEADHVYLGSITENLRYQTIQVHTASAPPANYVYDWETGQLTQWSFPSAPEVDTKRFVRATLESYPARDGTQIPMFVSRPQACDEKVCPVLVLFHGGPEGQARPYFSPSLQTLLDEGFVLVQPNVRGSTGYGKSWADSDNGAKRLDVITDIEDCSRYIRKAWARDGDAPKIGVLGGSYGGYATLMAMTYFAGAFDAGMSNVGISNLLTFLENTAPYRRLLRVNEYGDPVKEREALIELSPTTYAKKLKAPLLMIQGASDPRVPVGEAIQMYEAAKGNGVPVQLVIFPDEGHGASSRKNRVRQQAYTLEFFKKHLK